METTKVARLGLAAAFCGTTKSCTLEARGFVYQWAEAGSHPSSGDHPRGKHERYILQRYNPPLSELRPPVMGNVADLVRPRTFQ